jgi:hypothetical protein
MKLGHVLVVVMVLVFVITPVVSGPLVGGIDFTNGAQANTPAPGEGSAEVRVLSVPNRSVMLERGSFGAGTYHIKAPPARVEVTAITGNPVLRYSITIPALDLIDTVRYELYQKDEGEFELELQPFEISPQRIKQRRYDATISVGVLGSGRVYNLLSQNNVTITVKG